MERKFFTKELLDVVEHLKDEGHLIDVNGDTLPGIYTFRTYSGIVMIWNVRSVWTDRKEVLFDCCIGRDEFKEGGVYYVDMFSRHLRIKTGTNGKEHRV